MFREFRQRYPTVEVFALASKIELQDLFRPLGLAWRVPLLHQLARRLAALNGDLSEDPALLRSLPGVGPYASAATASLHGSTRAAIIDANIVRVICRIVGAAWNGETRRKQWLIKLAEQLTPQRAFRDYGYAMLDLSMTICKPRSPDCDQCPLINLCATGRCHTEGRI